MREVDETVLPVAVYRPFVFWMDIESQVWLPTVQGSPSFNDQVIQDLGGIFVFVSGAGRTALVGVLNANGGMRLIGTAGR